MINVLFFILIFVLISNSKQSCIVQHGFTQIPDGNKEAIAILEKSVNMTQSFILFTTSTVQDRPENSHVMSSFVNNSALYFRKVFILFFLDYFLIFVKKRQYC